MVALQFVVGFGLRFAVVGFGFGLCFGLDLGLSSAAELSRNCDLDAVPH